MSTKPYPPYWEERTEQVNGTNTTIFSGQDYEMLMMMAKKLNFNFRRLAHPTWEGVSNGHQKKYFKLHYRYIFVHLSIAFFICTQKW